MPYTIYIIDNDTASGTIPFEADSDAAAIVRGKELDRANIEVDGSITSLICDAGYTCYVETALYRKQVNYPVDCEVLGVEDTKYADRVADWAFNVKRDTDGSISITESS